MVQLPGEGAALEKLLPYFSFAGRANRQRYWLTTLALYGALLAAGLVATAIPVVGAVIAFAVFIAFVWVALAVSTRRLHDRNKSAWWLLLLYLPLLLLSFAAGAVSISDPDAGAALNVLSLPFTIWAFIELGCLRGTVGTNRFGPDPLQPVSEVFA